MSYKDNKQEAETVRERIYKIRLSDADVERLAKRALSYNLSPAELLENFIGDLVDGTYTNGSDERMYGKKFKMDVLGNDKNYGVNIVNPGNHTLLVFEAVIDCMSYIDMYKDYDSNKLILGMVEDTPLVQFLKDYNHIDTIHFCLDNDEAAHKALYGKKDESGNAISQGLVKKYEDQGFITDVIIPPSGKDFNEALLIQKKQQVETINNKTYGGR